MKRFLIFFIIAQWMVTGCTPHHESLVVTKKIQYDVPIKSPEPEYDWWIQNLVGPQREQVVALLLDGAKSGKYQAYDYFFQPITADQVKSILSDTVLRKLRRNTPPYELYDTVVVTNIRYKDILRLRFLEEWCTDPSTFRFEKVIYGVAPIARRVDQAGNVRWQPLFWIVPDAKVAEGLRNEVE